MALIQISSPQNQLRQNRTLLIMIGSASSLAGLLLWSFAPFAWANPKNNTQIALRYLSLITSLGCGVAAVASGQQLNKIQPLIRAIQKAETDDFMLQLAVSQFRQEQEWQQAAVQPAIAPSVQPAVQVQDGGSSPGGSTSGQTSAELTNPEVADIESFRGLYKAVSSLQVQGVSDTKIIEEVLNLGGRRFNEGKAALAALIQLGEQQKWQ